MASTGAASPAQGSQPGTGTGRPGGALPWGSIPKTCTGPGKDKLYRGSTVTFSNFLTRRLTPENSTDLSSGPGPHANDVKNDGVSRRVRGISVAAAAAAATMAAAAAAAGSRRRPLPPLSHMPMHIHASM